MGAGDDGIEHLVDVPAADDRTLDLREALEQALAFGERLDQLGVLRGLAVAELAQAALRGDQALQPHGLGEHARHPASQVALLGGEDQVVVAREDHRVEPVVADWGAQRLAIADPGDLEAIGLAAADPQKRIDRDVVAAEARGGHRSVGAEHDPNLGLERLRGALDRLAHRGRLVVGNRDRGQELGQLLRRPACRNGRHAASAPASRSPARRRSGCGDRRRNLRARQARPSPGSVRLPMPGLSACRRESFRRRARPRVARTASPQSRWRPCRRTRGRCPRRCPRCPGAPRGRRR